MLKFRKRIGAALQDVGSLMQHIGEVDPPLGRERCPISLEDRNSEKTKVVDSWCRPLKLRLDFLRLPPHRTRVGDELNEQFFNRATDVLQIPERLPNLFESHGPQDDTGTSQPLSKRRVQRPFRSLIVVEFDERLSFAVELNSFPRHALLVLRC